MKLTGELFKAVVRDTVLVGLDLLLLNECGEVLVGRRRNSPARGFFFVPGGRVFKGESLEAALGRVAREETGLVLEPEQATLHGIYEHNYKDSCFDDPGLSTQYVVIACRCAIPSGTPVAPDLQHESLHFMAIGDLLSDPQVHAYTKNYFRADAENHFLGRKSATGTVAPSIAADLGPVAAGDEL